MRAHLGASTKPQVTDWARPGARLGASPKSRRAHARTTRYGAGAGPHPTNPQETQLNLTTNEQITQAFHDADTLLANLFGLSELLATRGWSDYEREMNARANTIQGDIVLWLTELLVAVNIGEHYGRLVETFRKD